LYRGQFSCQPLPAFACVMAAEQLMASSDIHRVGVVHSDLPHHRIELRWHPLPTAYPVLPTILATGQGRVRTLAPAWRRTSSRGGVEPAGLLPRGYQWHRITAIQPGHEMPPVLTAVIATIE